MPQKGKVKGEHDAVSDTEEPSIGAKVEAAPEENTVFEQPVSQETEHRMPETKPVEELGLEDSPDVDIHDIAVDVLHASEKLAEAETECHESRDHQSHDDEMSAIEENKQTFDKDSFFSDWKGLDERDAPSVASEIEEQPEVCEVDGSDEETRSLAELGLSSGMLQTLDPASTDEDSVSKHDELAQAVQAALMNVYGEPFATPWQRAPSPVQSEKPSPGLGWIDEDTLSPQDVILNYFDYQPRPGPEKGLGSFFEPADDTNTFAHAGDLPSSWKSFIGDDAVHNDPASHPLPAPLETVRKGTDRETGRLLGAAAIGLICGIAIAASLAVFVINSYGPGGPPQPGLSNQIVDASQTGYGPLGKHVLDQQETQKPASVRASDEGSAISVDDVTVVSGQASPLPIRVRHANENSLISITGVPEGARLNAGVVADAGNWVLPPQRLNELTLTMPAGVHETVLGVQLLDGDGRTPLSEKQEFPVHVTMPQNAPVRMEAVRENTPLGETLQSNAQVQNPSTTKASSPVQAVSSFFNTETVASGAPYIAPSPAALKTAASPQQASLTRPSKAEMEALIREGNKHMREGDILEARRIYQKAMALGEPDAELALGRSYDPIYVTRIDKRNAEPDAAKAFDWYRKALDGGEMQTAKLRIEKLKHYLNQ